MNQDNGGVIGKINTPTTTLASGVWSLDSQFDSQASSIWPLAFPQVTFTNSCRFNDDDSNYLNKTFSGNGNRRTFTLSWWFKNMGGNVHMKSGSSGDFFTLDNNSDRLRLNGADSSVDKFQLISTQVFRDSAAWYNFVAAFDTTQSTSSDRVKFYVNGSQVTSFAVENYPTQNYETQWGNSSLSHGIGARPDGNHYFDGYMTEIIYVDGQQLTPSSFGLTNPVSNIWEPRAYTGTYGTNGFKLNFSDSSNLGDDTSGNGNDFTAQNMSSVNQCTDTCSNNFATFNSLAYFGKGSALQDGNTTAFGDSATSNNEGSFSNIPVSNGKWYTEFKIASMGTKAWIGISDVEYTILENNDAQYRPFTIMVNSDGRLDVRGSGYGAPTSTASWSASYTTNDILQVAIDLDNNYFYFGKNGTYQNSGDPTSGSSGTGGVAITSGKNYAFAFGGYGSSPSAHVNFGNPAFSISSGNADANGHGNFEYSVPSGYFALCTKNLAEFGG